jgi:hypothetical protein
MNATKTQATAIVRAYVVDPTAATVCEPTSVAPSTRQPKLFDKAMKIASIKAMCAARLAAFEAGQ